MARGIVSCYNGPVRLLNYTMKTCTVCKTAQPLENFAKAKGTKDGLNYRCRQCGKDYYARNRERFSEYRREKNLKDPESNRQRVAKWQRENREKKNENNRKWLAKNKESMVQTRRKWVESNPAKVGATWARRRCAKLMATPSWADKDAILAIYEECDRLTAETGIKHNVDHIIPLTSKLVCGLHCEFNLRAIPAHENFKKGNRFKPITEYAGPA